MLKLTDKVAIITGGNSGIGEAAAKLFAKQGAAVVLVARRADKLTAVADEIAAAGGKALAIPADVTDPATAVKVCEETVKQFGKIDILVNSAGEGDYTRPITGVTDEFFDHIVKVDQYAVFYMCREVVKYMQSAHSGSIVNISSVGGVFHNSGFAYAAAKSAVIGMTRNMAMQFAAEGIRVNAVCPGNFLDGPLWSDPVRGLFVQYLEAGKVPGAKTVADVRRYYEAKVPMNRGCLSVDVARAVMYCVEQKYETGQAIPVTGGQVMLN